MKFLILCLYTLVVFSVSIKTLTNKNSNCGENVSCGSDYECCFSAKIESYACSLKTPDEKCAYLPLLDYVVIEPVCDVNKSCPEGKTCCIKPIDSSSHYQVKCIENTKKCHDEGFIDPAVTQKVKGKISKFSRSLVYANIFGRAVKKQLKEDEKNTKYDDVTCSENKTCGSAKYDCCHDDKHKSSSCQLKDKTQNNASCNYGYIGSNYSVVEPVCSSKKACGNGDVCCYKYEKDDTEKIYPHYVKCSKHCTGSWVLVAPAQENKSLITPSQVVPKKSKTLPSAALNKMK